ARMRFFRPGVCGAFGATAAVAKVMGCDLETTTRAMGLLYSQICGTLQSHPEVAMINSMQTGFNAKAAVIAVALAQHDITAPQGVLEGEYETIASLPGFIMVFEEPVSYSLGSNIRTRKAKRCLVRVLIGLIPPKGLPRLQTCPRQRSSPRVAMTSGTCI